MKKIKNLILGGGLSGISCSYHLGHAQCLVLEEKPELWGLLATRQRNGFTWDNGPHVSFTKQEYVRELFENNTNGRFSQMKANVGNWFHGHWIRHPAQVNLFQAPADVRARCVKSFLQGQESTNANIHPANYQQWLNASLGEEFATIFSTPYTQKYWTVPPHKMSCDWVGGRVHRPRPEDVLAGSRGETNKDFHYVQEIRYPIAGGYKTFVEQLAEGINARLNSKVVSIDLKSKTVLTENGSIFAYERLISTIPLPDFVQCCEHASPEMKAAAAALLCTSAVLVEFELPDAEKRPEHWLYVYDSDKFATRINWTEKLSPNNAPKDLKGVQVEVYYSREFPLTVSDGCLAQRVEGELVAMGIIEKRGLSKKQVNITKIPYANVVFLANTATQLEIIWRGFEAYGLQREVGDVHPLSDWSRGPSAAADAPLIMAGRFGQWKYFWTDDCIMRGRQLAIVPH
ncbi:MAG: FAD-dependent oxidoreductase [Puniceicoccales bacterium]|jgi:protoporphyrinogen oxidase|nr:FAD-dependent oxidoreductase [Puniceicoccales bacterium]